MRADLATDFLFSVVKMEPSREGGCCAVQCILGDDGYSVDGIVGRKPDVDNPPHFLWLIKWYEYVLERKPGRAPFL